MRSSRLSLVVAPQAELVIDVVDDVGGSNDSFRVCPHERLNFEGQQQRSLAAAFKKHFSIAACSQIMQSPGEVPCMIPHSGPCKLYVSRSSPSVPSSVDWGSDCCSQQEFDSEGYSTEPDYRAQVDARIARNQAALAALGIPALAQALEAAARPIKPRQVRQRREPAPTGPRRRSQRIAAATQSKPRQALPLLRRASRKVRTPYRKLLCEHLYLNCREVFKYALCCRWPARAKKRLRQQQLRSLLLKQAPLSIYQLLPFASTGEKS